MNNDRVDEIINQTQAIRIYYLNSWSKTYLQHEHTWWNSMNKPDMNIKKKWNEIEMK